MHINRKAPERKKENASWPGRYVIDKKGNEADLFMRAFLMIKSAQTGGGRLFREKQKRELLAYMEDLGLMLADTPPELEEEWGRFAEDYLENFLHSRSYGSTLFGMVQMKEDWVLQKLAEDLENITAAYPARFGLEKQFLPLKKIFQEKLDQL